MSTTFVAITLTYALTATVTLYASYKNATSHPHRGLEPYLQLTNLIPIWAQIIPLWTTRPFPIRWISRLGKIVTPNEKASLDARVMETVDRALITYQTTCAFLIGILVIPFIWISRHNNLQQTISLDESGYMGNVLWCVASATCVGCYLLWNQIYGETRQRIMRLVASSTLTTSSDIKTPSRSPHELQNEK